jgi:hypothetical protein
MHISDTSNERTGKHDVWSLEIFQFETQREYIMKKEEKNPRTAKVLICVIGIINDKRRMDRRKGRKGRRDKRRR